MVRVKDAVAPLNTTAGLAVLVLPAGYRPPGLKRFVVPSGTTGFSVVAVAADGTVSAYPSASTVAMSLEVSFAV